MAKVSKITILDCDARSNDNDENDVVKVGETYEQALERCIVEEGDQVPFLDPGTNSWKCFKLLEKGPCATGEWLVLGMFVHQGQ